MNGEDIVRKIFQHNNCYSNSRNDSQSHMVSKKSRALEQEISSSVVYSSVDMNSRKCGITFTAERGCADEKNFRSIEGGEEKKTEGSCTYWCKDTLVVMYSHPILDMSKEWLLIGICKLHRIWCLNSSQIRKGTNAIKNGVKWQQKIQRMRDKFIFQHLFVWKRYWWKKKEIQEENQRRKTQNIYWDEKKKSKQDIDQSSRRNRKKWAIKDRGDCNLVLHSKCHCTSKQREREIEWEERAERNQGGCLRYNESDIDIEWLKAWHEPVTRIQKKIVN